VNWRDIARELPVNGSTQIECPENCGSGEKLSVNNSIKSYWCNCYRCGFTDTEFKGKQTLAELQKIEELNKQAEEIDLPMELPNDYTKEIPLEGRLWLYKAGITESVWRKYSIGYSAKLERVVLPVFDSEGKLVWYQCRALQHGQKPKYIQPSRDRSGVMFYAGHDSSIRKRAIVVEDILSAIRVGEHIATYSLLGTKITTEQATELGKYETVTTWMDPDFAGRQGAYKIRRSLSLLTNVSNIVTDKDPKELSNKELLKWINLHT
jgi:hypothetical protein